MTRIGIGGIGRGGSPHCHPRRTRFGVCYTAVLLSTLACVSCARHPQSPGNALSTVREVRHLPPQQAKLGARVHITGILTFYDPLTSRGFVQDATGGIRVTLAPGQTPPPVGWKVEVTGLTVSAGNAPAIVDGRLVPLALDVLPHSLALNAQRLHDPTLQYRRMSVAGVVRSVAAERAGQVTVGIQTPWGGIQGYVPASLALINEDLVDAEVRATGVSGGGLDDNGNVTQPVLWIPNTDAFHVRSPAKPPNTLAVTQTDALLAIPLDRLPAHRVRVRGVPYAPEGGGLAVIDEAGQISVRMAPGAMKPDATELDLAGFLVRENGRTILDRAVPTGGVGDGNWYRAPDAGSVLTTAAAVHQLPASVAQLAYAVHLRAVVTYFDPVNYLLFVQDATDGIFVQWLGNFAKPLVAGDLVDIIGVTTADFAPDVGRARVRVIGHRGLPEPETGKFANAMRGREDCRWLELEGTVQQVVRSEGDTLVTLEWGRDRFKAHVLAPPDTLKPLVDAEVRIRGVCGGLFNGRHQLLGIQMFVPGRQFIQVLQMPAGDPFSMPPNLIGDLLQFSKTHNMGHRVRIRGTVTYGKRAASTWIRDATGGLMLQDLDAEGLAPGDVVDAVGFPTIVGFGPVLRGAQVRKLDSGAPPAPLRISAQQGMTGDFDGQLVEIEGKIVDRLPQPPEQILAIESGGTMFDANLLGGAGLSLEPGTVVRITGICSVEVQQLRDQIVPRTFRLLLRSPADIAVVSRPPWLTADRVAPILAGALLLIVAALAWAALLRRRVRTQTHVLRTQTVQLQAAHQRTRMALQKAREAEALDLDSKRIVELIARDEPADLIIDHIAEAVAVHAEGAACVILLAGSSGLQVCAVPALPPGWLETLQRLELHSISFSPEFRHPAEFSDSLAWKTFIGAQTTARFRTFRAAPIVLDSSTAGVIATFFRNETAPADVQGDLALWCNIAALALERRRLHDQLSYRAHHDELTGLPNRSLVYERLEREIAQASRGGGLLGLLYLDLDGFKAINDTYGHSAGDAVLQQAARRMTLCVRRGDTVGRIGGDEFVVLLPRLSRREDAEQIAAKIAQALREPVFFEDRALTVGASVGIGIWPLDGNQADPLLRFADAEMYGQKKRRWYDSARPAPAAAPDMVATGPSEPARPSPHNRN